MRGDAFPVGGAFWEMWGLPVIFIYSILYYFVVIMKIKKDIMQVVKKKVLHMQGNTFKLRPTDQLEITNDNLL